MRDRLSRPDRHSKNSWRCPITPARTPAPRRFRNHEAPVADENPAADLSVFEVGVRKLAANLELEVTFSPIYHGISVLRIGPWLHGGGDPWRDQVTCSV